jgi:hypothetical protein
MSDISRFLKKNKTVKENVFFPATKSILGEDGEPLKWEIRAVPQRENERIQNDCMLDVPIKGKPGQFRQKIDSLAYLNRLLVASIVDPDLHSAELQDSYGVNKPEDLLTEMIDEIGEYNALAEFVQRLNGIEPIKEEIDTAKN